MKEIHITTLLLLAIVPFNSGAVTTMAHPIGLEVPSPISTQTEFARSGTITRYLPSKSIVTIDGNRYFLSGKGGFKNSDLKPGKKIKYNLEHSSSDKMGHITRIWVEKKK